MITKYMITKIVTHTYEDWNKILNRLVDAGDAFYDFYGDIEAAILDNAEPIMKILLVGSKESWAEFDTIEKEV